MPDLLRKRFGLGLGLTLTGVGGGGGGSPLLDGLVSYWKFDESSGNAVDAVGANDLTNNGTVTYGAEKISNGARSFSDTNFFSIANNAEIDLFDKDFTFALWLRNTATGTRVFLCKGTALSQSANQLTLARTNTAPSGIYVEIGNAVANQLITGELVGATLRHVVVTFTKATKLLAIHVNGTKYTKTIAIDVPNAGGDLRIGKFYSNGFAISGGVDEMGFWSRVLTDGEIATLYNANNGNTFPFDDPAESIADQLIILGDSTIAAFLAQNSVGFYLTYGGAGGIVSIADPGDTVADQLALWIAASRARADVVCVQVGLNNINPAQASSVAITALQGLITRIGMDAPNASIMIGTMTPCKQRLIDVHGPVDGLVAYQQWLDINQAISGGGATPITGVDARVSSHTASLGDGLDNLHADYEIAGTNDHIHENNAGREIIAAAWQLAIDAF